MSSLVNLINNLCAEIRSDKVLTRNKAAEQLENLLNVSKNELLVQLPKRSDADVSWTTLFNSVIDATIKHAIKVDESRDSKSYQTMCNKSYIFAAIINKLVDYNLEDPEHLFSKATLFNGFQEGFKTHAAISQYFELFLGIINQGLFKSPIYVRQLKLNEFSIILSYLFKSNKNDELIRFSMLKTINKTIEIACDYVQINADVIEYFPEIMTFASSASKDYQKAEVIKFYYLMVSQHSVDYHSVICNGLQDLLPILSGYYQNNMKIDTKELLFKSILISLHVLYPYIQNGDVNTINVTICGTWPKTLKRLRTLVEVEIKERCISHYQTNRLQNDKSFEVFIKMSALIIYVNYWHAEDNAGGSNNNNNNNNNININNNNINNNNINNNNINNNNINNNTDDDIESAAESRKKQPKMSDKLEVIMNFIQESKSSKINEMWFAILSEIIDQIDTVINITNFQQLLMLNLNIFQDFLNIQNLKNLRLNLLQLLEKEQEFNRTKAIPIGYCHEIWQNMVKLLINDTSSCDQIIKEIQIILQNMIKYQKLSSEQCITLLNSFMSNPALRRTECVLTVQQILINADRLGLDKTAEFVSEIIAWMYGDRNKNEAKTLLLHIEPIPLELIAKTCAIAVINFLNPNAFSNFTMSTVKNSNLQLLLYKYNRKLLCLEVHGKELKLKSNANSSCTSASLNCLFQNTYELLMRTLNFETSKGLTCKDILLDLSALLKMALLMKCFLQYDVFDAATYLQCPLIKRIGFFLSHLELQFKNNNPNAMERCTLVRILNLTESIVVCFASDGVLLRYLENQPIEEMINFLGLALRFCAKNYHIDSELDEWSSLIECCLKILAHLCASSSHCKDAFEHLANYSFNIKEQMGLILKLIKILCREKSQYEEIADWFVEKLKTIFRLYHTNIEIMEQIVEMMPAIFVYVEKYEDCLDNMLLAIASLFKISFCKSYSVGLTTKIINSISLISRDCRELYVLDNFKNICLSVVKFLPFESLQIQYAAINSLTRLMNAQNFKNTKFDIEIYYDFCESLYATIEWKKLQVRSSQSESPDQLQNSISLNVQLLVSLLCFSCYHREQALQELSYICALYKLTEAHFNEFQSIAVYYGRDLNDIFKPCLSSAIHMWISKGYPILKFPFYLCYKSKDNFVMENIEQILTCLLLYKKSDELPKLLKYGTKEELFKMAIPQINALLLSDPHLNSNHEFKSNMKNLLIFHKDIAKIKNDTKSWKIIYNLMELLRDDNHSMSLTNFTLYFQSRKWYNIDYIDLQKALNSYVNPENSSEIKPDLLLNLINLYPLILVKTLGALKASCSECIFPIDALKQFYKFYTLSQMIIAALRNPTVTSHLKYYFLRDIISYTLYCMETSQSMELQHLCSAAMEKFCGSLSAFFDIDEFLEGNCDFICKTLIRIYKTLKYEQIKLKIIDTLKNILTNYDKYLKDKEHLLNEFNYQQEFEDLKIILKSKMITMEMQQQQSNNAIEWKNVIENFLKNKNYCLESFNALKQQISKCKLKLLEDQPLLYKLMRQLLQIVRESVNTPLAMESLKCLGEIGPLHLEQMSFYFDADHCIEENSSSSDLPESFYKPIYLILEKLMKSFSTATHSFVIEVAQYLVNSKHGSDLLDSFPHFVVFRTNISSNYLDTYASIKPPDWLGNLKNTEAHEYEKWICTFMSQLYKECEWQQFHELAANNKYFAETSLIPFVRLLMRCGETDAEQAVIAEQHMNSILYMLEYFVDEFMKNHQGSGSEGSSSNASMPNSSKLIYKDKRVINIILNICECIRIKNQWQLPLNLLNVAEACNYCQSYFLSIIYLELWSLAEKSTGQKTDIEIMSNEQFQSISRRAYESIGCLDAISGFINPLNSRLDYLNLTNNWSDILIESSNIENDAATAQHYNTILKRNGILNFEMFNNTKTGSASTVDYEICWRLCRWDTLVEGHSKVNTLNDMEYEFEKHHFNALKCLYNKEENNTLAAVTKSRQCVATILKQISFDCLQSVYKYLTWLQLLQQAEDFCAVQFSTSQDLEHIFVKWQMEIDDLKYGRFKNKEIILSHQLALFETAGIRANRKIKEFYKDDPRETCLLKCIRECKMAGEMNLAKRYVAILKSMPLANAQMKVNALLEDAEICMRTGKTEITKAILPYVLKKKEFQFCLQRVKAMHMNGEYLLETNNETFETVHKKYFHGTFDVLDKLNKYKVKIVQANPNLFQLSEFSKFEQDSRKNAYEIIAKYADREYTQLFTYANSDQFQMKKQLMKLNRQTAETVSRTVKDHDKIISANFMKRTSENDEKDIELIEWRLSNNLCLAVENYMKFACLDDAISSSIIYRIIGLWFANKQNASLLVKIQEHIAAVPSYKFICALNQMTARLNSTANKEFIEILKNIMIRCIQDHPHQTLYQLYPLVYGHIDGTQNKTDIRSTLAQDIINRARNKSNVNIIKQLEIFIPALVEFANTDMKSATIPLSDKLKKIKTLDAVHCPTIDLPVRIDKQYQITAVLKWNSTVCSVGGINTPKKLICHCSDGRERPQLLKSKDDLRQDAVMQQVFSMINNLLQQETDAVERKLLIRTYKVVPLSTRSGILEWCENTVPIGTYLINAHEKYRPKDYIISKCKEIASQHLKSDSNKRYGVHVHICRNIKPIFHYFFLEKFHRPGIWFEKRLAYMNSVATTSMVGYILGLGDRHTQNILIDKKSAEVIHIDFGIAFEQGKILTIPETVPFRLTRDMVAPMGISGPNGVFKKSCETTMAILRKHQSVITTILEVLLYDPLYTWKVIPQVDDDNNQEEDAEKKNFIAQRALIVIQNKLEGKQTGIFGTSGVSAQVERLINDAMSDRNLCMLFPGWDPYL